MIVILSSVFICEVILNPSNLCLSTRNEYLPESVRYGDKDENSMQKNVSIRCKNYT